MIWTATISYLTESELTPEVVRGSLDAVMSFIERRAAVISRVELLPEDAPRTHRATSDDPRNV